MPVYNLMVELANQRFNRENIGLISLEALGPELNLVDGAAALEIARNKREIEFLGAWPPGQQAAIVAAVRSALESEPRMPVTFAWAPGYDFEVTIWESAGMEGSPGAMTILLRSRYPGDQIPGTLPRRGRTQAV